MIRFLGMQKALIKKISDLFDLPALTYVGIAKGGFLSNNYILKSKNTKYFLKRYRAASYNWLPVASKAEVFFAKQAVPIIMPLKTKTNKTFFAIDGNSYSLFPFVDGKTFNHRTGKLTPDMAKSFATNLAQMHLLSKNKYPKITKVPLSEWDTKHVLRTHKHFHEYSTKILEIIRKKSKKTEYDKLALQLIKLKTSLVDSTPTKFNASSLGKKHIVHGDYHAQNMFINRQGNVTHVFDLEKADIRPRSLELARSILLICFNSQFTAKKFNLAKIYLKAYNAIYPIKRSELESAIRFICYKNPLNLWMEKEHYLHKNRKTDKLIAGELRFLKYMSKNLDKFIAKISKNF